MDYPKWAPQDLVEDHQRHLRALKAGPLTESEADASGLLHLGPECQRCGCLKCQCVTNGDALSIFEDVMRLEYSQTEAREPILRRMICCEPMDIFWAWVEKQKLKDERHRDAIPYVIWYHLKIHLIRFEKYPTRTNTDKKKALNRIRKAAEELHAAILADDDANETGGLVMRETLKSRNLRYRREVMRLGPSPWTYVYEGETDLLDAQAILSGGYRFGADSIAVGRHPGDGNQSDFPAYVLASDDADEEDYLPWHKQPIEQRLAWWRHEIEEVSLLELLNHFCHDLRNEAERPSPVKQRREDGGKHAYFIRAAASVLKSNFQTAPPERVADLAGVILDVPLGSEDVRPYLR